MISIKCPYCGNIDSKVTDSRRTEAGDAIRRRRECLICRKRFTTFERLEETPITLIKKDGGREPFSRQKLLGGLRRAIVKRNISTDQIEELVSNIESDLRNEFKYEITSNKLGEMVLERLRKLDKVAYVRFASVYREFQNVEEFTSELSKLQPPDIKNKKKISKHKVRQR